MSKVDRATTIVDHLAVVMSIRDSNYITFTLLLLLPFAFFPSLFVYTIHLPLRIFSSDAYIPHSVTAPPTTMSWVQKSFTLPTKSRGSYLITDHVTQSVPEIKGFKVGLLNLFVQHTSCALSMNENWDEEVREDMSDALDRIAPEDKKGNLYRHSAEVWCSVTLLPIRS